MATNHDCTEMLHFIPCREEINTEETAALYTKDHQQNKLKIMSTYKRLQSPQTMQARHKLQALIASYRFLRLRYGL